MQGTDNVVRGDFGQSVRREQSRGVQTAQPAPLTQSTPETLEHRFASQTAVLDDLAQLLSTPGVDPTAVATLSQALAELQQDAAQIRPKLAQAATDEQMFLAIQSDIAQFGKKLVIFETHVMRLTGATHEYIDSPSQPVSIAIPFYHTPMFWLCASISVAALSGFAYVKLSKKDTPKKEPRASMLDFKGLKSRKGKLRRTVPAR